MKHDKIRSTIITVSTSNYRGVGVWLIIVLIIITMAKSYAGSAKAHMLINTLEEPPTNFTDNQGNLTGISVEVVREIQKRIRNVDPILVQPWARTYFNVLNKPNVIAFTAARTPEREKKFHWIFKVNRNAYKFYSKKGSGTRIKNIEDAKGLERIGVLRSSVWESSLKKQGFTNLDGATTHAQNVRKLMAGRFDAIYFTTAGLFQTCITAGVSFDDLEPVFTYHQVESYIIMSKNGTPKETVDLWIKTGREIKNDGTYQKIADKWIRYMKNHDGFITHFDDGAINYWQQPDTSQNTIMQAKEPD